MDFKYCKSTNFGVLLYLANLANCVFSLIFAAANIYVDRTLHRRRRGETPNLIAAKSLYFEKCQILQPPKFVDLQYSCFPKIQICSVIIDCRVLNAELTARSVSASTDDWREIIMIKICK